MKRLGSIWEENKVYFIAYILVLLVGLVFISFIEKGDAVLFLNDYHSPTLDLIFRYWTKMGEEWPFIIGFLILIFYKVRHAIYIPILGAMVTLISFLMKTFFGHARPSLYFREEGIFEELNKVDLINIVGGHTSFPSGHTMAAFTIFTYFAFHSKSPILKVLFLLIAVLAGISRIYLLQHFLQDVCLGSFCGVMIAVGIYYLQKLFRRENSMYEQPIYKLGGVRSNV